MDEKFKNAAKGLRKNIEMLQKMSNSTLQKIREQNPEQVDSLIADNSKVMKAIREGNVEELNKLHKKYADSSNIK